MFRRKHTHDWVSVARQDTQSDRYSPANTLVLQRCECGELCTMELDGTWTDEDLGIVETRVNDLRQVLAQTERT